MESVANVHIDNLAPAVLDLRGVLDDIRDVLTTLSVHVDQLHTESQHLRNAVEYLGDKARLGHRALDEVREALAPLHALDTISNHLERLVRDGLEGL